MTSSVQIEIQRELDDMYDAFQQRDWERFNVHLDPAVTAWESHLPEMIYGQAQLDAYRASRPAPPALSSFGAVGLEVESWGETALARYSLVGVDAGTAVERRSRVTEVFRRNADRWVIVHRHSERMTH